MYMAAVESVPMLFVYIDIIIILTPDDVYVDETRRDYWQTGLVFKKN